MKYRGKQPLWWQKTHSVKVISRKTSKVILRKQNPTEVKRCLRPKHLSL